MPLFILSRLISSLWVSRTGSASDWCALPEALYKCIDTIQYNDVPLGDRLPALGEHLIPVFYLDWSVLAAEYDLPYPVVSDNPVVVHDGDDEARLSDSVHWDGEHEVFVEDEVQCLLVDGCLLLLHFPIHSFIHSLQAFI